ncbi:MAG: hypothetical protein NC548_34050 [Lachnospiraceae bacterium]|nr:hypothetical protein [Lachnospiraceae bacterium]
MTQIQLINKLYEAVDQNYYKYYGLRCDGLYYGKGEKTHKSHIITIDKPEVTDYDILTSGYFKGWYESGECDGTNCIDLSSLSFEKALYRAINYPGENITLIAGNKATVGDDFFELCIEDAVCILQIDKDTVYKLMYPIEITVFNEYEFYTVRLKNYDYKLIEYMNAQDKYDIIVKELRDNLMPSKCICKKLSSNIYQQLFFTKGHITEVRVIIYNK